MSGLRCAKGILDDDDDDDADDDVNDFSVAVLEAKATIGGRVEQTEDVAPWPVELGAEFVHGEEANPIVRDVEDLGEEEEEDSERLRFSRFDWPDRYAMMTTTTKKTRIECLRSQRWSGCETCRSARNEKYGWRS